MVGSISVTEHTPPVALTIAGSDSGGGAGIQADLRTFAQHYVHGTSAITCVTAQNTQGVRRVDALPPESVVAQITTVAEDMGVAALKTGMLLNPEIIESVAETLRCLGLSPVVVDPVMVSRSGDQLLADTAIAAMVSLLFPLAEIVTPNCYEAELLTGQTVQTLDEMKAAAHQIFELGPQAVLIKGGGATETVKGTDVWFDGDRLEQLTVTPLPTRHTHGTGCTLSAAITANLALGSPPLTAVRAAKAFVTSAIQHPLAIGQGQGPIGHMYGRVTPPPLTS